MAGAVAQDEEDGRLGEALEPRANLPPPRAETTPAAGAARESRSALSRRPHSKLQCKTHIAPSLARG